MDARVSLVLAYVASAAATKKDGHGAAAVHHSKLDRRPKYGRRNAVADDANLSPQRASLRRCARVIGPSDRARSGGGHRGRWSPVHIGSQLLETQAARASVDGLASFAADCRAELEWTPAVG